MKDEYPIDWWNVESTFEDRQELCRRLGWHEGHADGEASLEWLQAEEINELKSVPYALLVEIESASKGGD